ncbi:TRAP transporter small permease [Mesorhizobium sp. KR9-304]|uniref:TRAP transporter small permease n=1 Tax=Mesorhizobium sp. KR9-304 TaxID=3156614 RepID=UPI0032B603CE
MQVNHPASSVEEMAQAFEEDAAPPADLSRYAFEDWLTLAVFWMMAGSVFLQFFTRYALNNSLSWTEEVATNLLMIVVFMGAAMCVRTSRHIHVDVLYHFLPKVAGRVLALAVDVLVIGFFAYMSLLIWRFVDIVADQRMISIDVPRSFLFYTLFAAFFLMLLRSIQVFVADVRRGYTVLESPEAFDGLGE